MNCPLCQEELQVRSGFNQCASCCKYLCTTDGGTEVIKNDKGRWWLWIYKGREIHLFQAGITAIHLPYAPINYQDPQLTIDRLMALKAFL